jgi:predicted transcriptional regulator
MDKQGKTPLNVNLFSINRMEIKDLLRSKGAKTGDEIRDELAQQEAEVLEH